MTPGGTIRDPHEWLRQQEQRTAALLATAQDAQAQLAQNSAVVTSPDRAVSITVNPGGGLTALTLSPDADRMGHRRLAALIMSTYQQAARQAATRTMEIMAGLVGPDSEALDLVRQAMPAAPGPEAPDAPPSTEDDGFHGFGGRR
ncbi:YbaB/EbfC family nucleoid-associated protein [Actinokineospora bangkokensis]|uniref:YbaB/EbfC family DNA-binding protein n=1 Tax=Actinokineospora bangkokensis TaxID=1193682 RepID=A0A1Q9LP69_9PSEU|nr:YbaB/EbfC family nucleoid-associated protein [Actinokineospora bangkokensis]OLR93847.1 hypothetical protein BJP25_16625 [Actinokineospora bangkokensis]